MKNQIKICIPSYGRPNQVYALKEISPELQQKYYWLCVRSEELDAYKENYPHCNYLDLGTDFGPRGVVETRQRINEKMSGKILVIDDDVTFRQTIELPGNSGGQPVIYMRYFHERNVNDLLEEMLDYLSPLMDRYAHGGIGSLVHPKESRKYLPYKENKVCLWAVWFNLDMFSTEEISYRHGPEFIEDVYMTCRFYDLGFDTCVAYEYSIFKYKITGSQGGGCNAHPDRSAAHNQSAEWLADNYPQYCVLKRSTVYHKDGSMGKPTNTVICRLKKRAKTLF